MADNSFAANLAADGGSAEEYGYNASGVEQLIADVKAIVLTEAAAKAQADFLDPINTACDNFWDGEAREKYKNNLKADAAKFAESLTTLCNAFETEVQNTAMSYKNFDKNLFNGE